MSFTDLSLNDRRQWGGGGLQTFFFGCRHCWTRSKAIECHGRQADAWVTGSVTTSRTKSAAWRTHLSAVSIETRSKPGLSPIRSQWFDILRGNGRRPSQTPKIPWKSIRRILKDEGVSQRSAFFRLKIVDFAQRIPSIYERIISATPPARPGGLVRVES